MGADRRDLFGNRKLAFSFGLKPAPKLFDFNFLADRKGTFWNPKLALSIGFEPAPKLCDFNFLGVDHRGTSWNTQQLGPRLPVNKI